MWQTILPNTWRLVEATNIGETKLTRFDTSCFDGDYVTGDISEEYLQQLYDARNDDAKQDNQEEDDVIDMHNDEEWGRFDWHKILGYFDSEN